ncbi:hypothetical protein HPB47_013765 [Ixodes persulcatus]|uniref:Uncharacterized protein n=1 Tax=Ixodes persulcatus TaxID=34615 RepID=A0AC60R195_IXOPE|nr:hypothetical protein HPB47_013765 [Ixodes persulcatus]
MAAATAAMELQDDGGTAATASSQEHGKGWLKVVRDRGKLRYRDEEADATAMHGAREPETTPRYRTTKRAVKQEPLPKNDYKIIMKPREGLNFAKWSNIAIARSLSQASELPIEAMRGRVIFRVQHDQNTVIISTADIELATRLCDIDQIRLGNAVHTYSVAPQDSAKGVIHDLEPEITQEILLKELWSRTHEIIYARHMGKTDKAIITFKGTTIPRAVYLYGGEYCCKPYRPTKQVYRICLKQGHRADVCPTPDIHICVTCGLPEPTEAHQCTPKCGICQGEHVTGSTECKERWQPTKIPRYGRPAASRVQHQRTQSQPIPEHQSGKQNAETSASTKQTSHQGQKSQARTPAVPSPKAGSATKSWADAVIPGPKSEHTTSNTPPSRPTTGQHTREPPTGQHNRESTTGTRSPESDDPLSSTSKRPRTEAREDGEPELMEEYFGARRGSSRPADGQTEETNSDGHPLTQYAEITEYYRLERQKLPPPHKELTREEAVVWRQLQTNTYRHLSLLHRWYPEQYNKECPFCHTYANLYHTVWECQRNPAIPPIPHPTPSQWEAVLLSSSLDDQRQLVDRARSAAKATGALD